jgi:hypothetical protein
MQTFSLSQIPRFQGRKEHSLWRNCGGGMLERGQSCGRATNHALNSLDSSGMGSEVPGRELSFHSSNPPLS